MMLKWIQNRRQQVEQYLKEHGITPRSSEKELDKALHDCGYFQPWQYVKDDDFECWMLNHILTAEQALAFCDQLDKEGEEYRAATGWSGSGLCSKARSARSWFTGENGKFWHEPNHVRAPLAHARRVCCGCHETGSFARRPMPKVELVRTSVVVVQPKEKRMRPMFSRSLYQAIADSVKAAKAKVEPDGGALKGVNAVVDELVATFRRDNPAFDPDRFRKAVYGEGKK